MDELLTDDFQFTLPTSRADGKEALRGYVSLLRQAFEGLRFEVEREARRRPRRASLAHHGQARRRVQRRSGVGQPGRQRVRHRLLRVLGRQDPGGPGRGQPARA
jgi:hypothetical protein